MEVIDRPPAELLGPGDLLHPWERDHTEPFVAGARWDVLEPARLAVLDRRFAAVIGRWTADRSAPPDSAPSGRTP